MMRKIDVDDEVFAYLQSKGITFVDTPNSTLRRLLNIETQLNEVSTEGISDKIRRKQPKTDMPSLIRTGLLHEGQTLYLHDYRGVRVRGYEAVISSNSILWEGQPYSLSRLARLLLRKEGYSNTSYRGPSHWYREDGISVQELWDQYLKESSNHHGNQ